MDAKKEATTTTQETKKEEATTPQTMDAKKESTTTPTTPTPTAQEAKKEEATTSQASSEATKETPATSTSTSTASPAATEHVKKFRILGISSSLRKGSTNSGLLRAAAAQAGPDVEFVMADISKIPLYNADDEAATGFPPSVVEFREQIHTANALLFACGENNYSIPGVLKNAIDWASRPSPTDSKSPFFDKAAAIVGSGGSMGSGRAHYHLRQVFVFLNVHALNTPELAARIWGPVKIFDDDGNVIDEETKNRLKSVVEALVVWAKRINPH